MTDNASKAPAAIGTDLGSVNDAAIAHARKNNLLADDGQIYCWNCSRLGGLLPSLHCRRCLDEALEQSRRDAQATATEHPETKRWSGILRELAHGGLNRELAERLVANAKGLPSATPERLAELDERFARRFGRAEAAKTWSGRGFRSSGTDRRVIDD